ncbi:MAG: universal stress protein [Flavobacteriales bacterium]|nr:universal stress protein [Flavobacteriales bacterium]
MQTGLESKKNDLDNWIHESSIWTSDVDFWLDEVRSFQKVLDKAVNLINDKTRLKSLDHLQNIVHYYGKKILIDLKSKIFHHRESMSSDLNGTIDATYKTASAEHQNIHTEVLDIEKRMREYKKEFRELKETIDLKEKNLKAPFKQVLIPTDFSLNASRAVDYALSILGSGTKTIKLIHVFDSFVPTTLDHTIDDAAAILARKEEFEKEISRIRKDFPDLASKVEPMFQVGNLNQSIEKILAEEKVDLLVMGTRGAGNGSLLFGSNTSSIVRSVSTPILVIPDEAPLLPPKRMLFACDLENVKRPEGMEIFKCIAQQYSADLRIVHVDLKEQPIDSAHERFNVKEVLEELSLEGENIEYVQSNDVLDGINEYVKNNMIDIAVTINHHEGFFKTLFSPSTTRQMVLHSHIPILVLHDNNR